MKYARIVKLFADRLSMPYEEALDFFYESDTYQLISKGIGDMHCLSDEYLADELWKEMEAKRICIAKEHDKSYTPDELCGILKDDGKSYEEMHKDYLTKKYGV